MFFKDKKKEKEEKEKLIQIAVRFLNNPKIINQTESSKIKFLKGKVFIFSKQGMKNDDIKEAFEL